MALAGRERSFSFFWFLLAGSLMILTAWFVYDEAIGRRTWKEYARAWTELETKRIEADIAKANKAIDPKKLKQIDLELEKAQAVLESEEFAQLQEELKQKQIALDKANRNVHAKCGVGVGRQECGKRRIDGVAESRRIDVAASRDPTTWTPVDADHVHGSLRSQLSSRRERSLA